MYLVEIFINKKDIVFVKSNKNFLKPCVTGFLENFNCVCGTHDFAG